MAGKTMKVRLGASLQHHVDEAVREGAMAQAALSAKAGAQGGGSRVAIHRAKAMSSSLSTKLPAMFAAYSQERGRCFWPEPELDDLLRCKVEGFFACRDTTARRAASPFGGSDEQTYWSTMEKERVAAMASVEEHIRRPGLNSWPSRHPLLFGITAFVLGGLVRPALEAIGRALGRLAGLM